MRSCGFFTAAGVIFFQKVLDTYNDNVIELYLPNKNGLTKTHTRKGVKNMRRESTIYNAPEVKRLAGYHGGTFESLKAFNSDRVINLDRNYTVSERNTASTKKIAKVGSHLNLFGIELETISPLCKPGHNTPESDFVLIANILGLAMDKAGFPDDFWKYEKDCTVSAECVSQTFTKAWMRNNYKVFKAMYEMFPNLKVTTNDPRCGMHVNIDLTNLGGTREEQIDNARKLGYFINKHYDLCKVAVNRLGDNTWCPPMRSDRDYWKETPLYGFNTSHSGCCVNMGHVDEGRIEIRLVGGQKNYPCFRNTMETVFFMVDRVKKISWKDLDNVGKFFEGCNRHVWDRLKTNCKEAGVISDADLERIAPTVKEIRYL